LGLGDTTQRTVPTQVGSDEWASISCGYHHSVGIKTDKTLWTWGCNEYGQLGQGDYTQKTLPTQVGSDEWKVLATGSNNGHTLALK
jgi:alpha-tubulin suppressor-like RCC1 family protein